MLYCNNCKVNLPGAPIVCPLCQGEIIGEPESGAEAFPVVPAEAKPNASIFSLFAFAAIAAAAICVAINLSIPASGWWSLFVLVGIASLWISIALIPRFKNNIPKGILWQMGIISVLAYQWDKFTGFNRWSVDYVIPILCTCALVAMAIVAKLMRIKMSDYLVYLVIDCVFGVLTLLLILLGIPTVVFPSAICFAVSDIFLAALFFFEGDMLRKEIARRLHI